MGVPQLTYQDPSTGDLKGSSVSFRIKIIDNNGTIIRSTDKTISGKCTSLYQESYEFDIPTGTAFPIRAIVERLTADATKVNTQNKIFWYTYTEHIAAKLSYPNSAIINTIISADQFSVIPQRGFEIKGIKVRVPVNYNPETRTYTGEWNGTFKIAWTNNPVWIYYDLIVEDRYGLGDILNESQIDKWSLYPIAKYCDELVPTGFGGLEPRFTCNTYIQSQSEAYQLLTTMASVFRAMQYWAASQMSLSADMPKDPVAQYTQANVIDGLFNYSGTSLKTRHTVAQVTWNDPKDLYRQKIEYVEDTDGLQKYGIVATDVVAVGCTSQGQAHRLGRWILYTEQMETETVTFKVSLEHAVLMPGDVIQTVDTFRSGRRFGGRIKEQLALNQWLLDIESPEPDSYFCEYNLVPDATYNVSIFVPYLDTKTNTNRAKLETRSCTINNGILTNTGIPFSVPPEPGTVWVASIPGQIEPETWRVIAVTEEDDLQATITALEYRKDKFLAVERNLVLEERPTTLLDYKQPDTPVPLLNPDTQNETSWYQEYLYWSGPGILNNGATFSWSSSAAKFLFRWAYQPSDPEAAPVWEQREVLTPTIDLKPLEPGNYKIEIVAINVLGYRSKPFEATITLLGKMAPPQDVAGFVAQKTPNGILVKWDANTFDLDLDGYEVRELLALPSGAALDATGQVTWTTATNTQKNQIWDSALKVQDGRLFNTSYLDPFSPLGYNTYLVKAIDSSGNYSSLPAICGIQVSAPRLIPSSTWALSGEDFVLKWTPPQSDLGIASYDIGYDNLTVTVDSAEFRQKAWWTGTKYFSIVPIDNSGNRGATYNTKATLGILQPPQNLTIALSGDSYKLSWQAPEPNGSLPVDAYEIRTDLNWGIADNNLIALWSGSTFQAKVTWAGNRTFYVAGRDTSGTIGNYSSVSLTIQIPSAPVDLRDTVVDNNVLLYWKTPTVTSLPVIEYDLRRGESWATAEIIGTKSGKFTSVFETVAGEYRYWLAAVDSAGNIGTPVSIVSKVNQPPDYILQSNYSSTFPGTKSNAYVNIDGSLSLPVNTAETWQSHFTERSWTTPQNQVDAGYPIYTQPTPASGYYEETIDYTPGLSSLIDSSNVTIAINVLEIVSSEYIIEVYHSENGTNWVGPLEGGTHYITNFKYVKVRFTVNSGLVNLQQLNIRLDSKLRTQNGMINCSASDTGGTTVYLTRDKTSTGEKTFLDVDSINLTPSIVGGSVPVAIYDFVDTPQPLSFKILLLDSQTGARVSGMCSYSVRGY